MQILRPQPSGRTETLKQEVAQTEASLLQELNAIKENLTIEKAIGELRKLIPDWLYRPVFLAALIGLLSAALLFRLLFPAKPKIIIQNPYAYPPMPLPEHNMAASTERQLALQPPQPQKSSFLWELLQASLKTVVLHLVKTRLIKFLDTFNALTTTSSQGQKSK
jgi:hypothetical protein